MGKKTWRDIARELGASEVPKGDPFYANPQHLAVAVPKSLVEKRARTRKAQAPDKSKT